MIGVSVSTDRTLMSAAELMRVIKESTANRHAPVVVGGALDLSDFAREHGAALAVSDPHAVVEWLLKAVSPSSQLTDRMV